MTVKADPGTAAKGWSVFVICCLALFSLATQASYFKLDIISIWVLSCIGILYLARRDPGTLTEAETWRFALAGAGLAVFSFINVPLGFGNPPYSVGDFTLLLSGIGILAFALLRYRAFLLPAAFPAIIVIGFQVYELLIRHQDWISAPLIPPVVFFTVLMLNAAGIGAVSNGNLITFVAQTGEPITLAVVSDCAGMWSLGTFTAATLIVLSSFPQGRTRRGMTLVAIGYLGTYCANILRVTIIALSGFLFGPAGVIENAHIHVGWVIFTTWMVIFWYYFFTRILDLKVPLPTLGGRR